MALPPHHPIDANDKALRSSVFDIDVRMLVADVAQRKGIPAHVNRIDKQLLGFLRGDAGDVLQTRSTQEE